MIKLVYKAISAECMVALTNCQSKSRKPYIYKNEFVRFEELG